MADSPRIEELQRRVERDPASIAFAQLAEEHRRIGNYDQAIRVCREGLARHPSYLSARVTLGRALLELEQYDDAHRELDQVLRLAPDNLAAIRALAEIHQRRGELGEAARQFTTALDMTRADLVFPAVHLPELELPEFDFPQSLPPGLDDFSRSLEALDAMTLDLPAPAVEFALPDFDIPGDVASEPFAAPVPESPALRELETWLAAILRARAGRAGAGR